MGMGSGTEEARDGALKARSRPFCHSLTLLPFPNPAFSLPTGTARTVPEDDLGMVALQMQQHHIEALMIIGGFEAFLAMGQLLEHRAQYPQFGSPMILLPATISNNVPGTEISLGTDTSLNIIVQSCDEVKQSASSTTRRVFVVEVMGGKCGFLATMAALAAAATRAYIPEKGITFSDLAEDIMVRFLARGAGCTAD